MLQCYRVAGLQGIRSRVRFIWSWRLPVAWKTDADVNLGRQGMKSSGRGHLHFTTCTCLLCHSPHSQPWLLQGTPAVPVDTPAQSTGCQVLTWALHPCPTTFKRRPILRSTRVDIDVEASRGPPAPPSRPSAPTSPAHSSCLNLTGTPTCMYPPPISLARSS